MDENLKGGTEDNRATILEVRNLSKVFPGTIALENVNIKFTSGEVHGIIGKNGAGKSTLVNILSGIIPPSAGEIIIKGKIFTHINPDKAKREGITIVTQNPEIVPDFSVVENLFLPGYLGTTIGTLKWKQMSATARQIFEHFGLDLDLGRKMRDLSLDEKQIFLILKAFFVDRQDLVLLDEVTTSFSGREETFFFEIIREQKRAGKSIIFISHRLDEILTVCDRISVIRDGKIVATAERGCVTNEDLCSMVVGVSNSSQAGSNSTSHRKEISTGDIFSVQDLSREGIFENVSFSLRNGEILGFAGLVGSGRTEILKALAGLEPADSGTITLDGRKTGVFRKSWEALNSGIVYLTENRDEEGLISMLSVGKNLTLSYLVSLAKGFFIKGKQEKRLVNDLIDSFDILASSPEEEVENLSGGNRQKVLCGRIASTGAKVLLLDEPTKGIDIGAKSSILSAIRDILSKTAGVVMTSPGLDDLLIICDRIIALFEGRVVAEYQRGEFNELTIYKAIQGLEGNLH